jgi:hypothetical protein
MSLNELVAKLEPAGLYLRGVLRLTTEEIESLEIDSYEEISIALVGNIGSSYWPVFSQSSEYKDGQPDPLDRWSKRVAEQVAKEIGASAIYPFEGPPYFPFQQWARRAEALSQSPLGLMIHPQYGLWHSYRFGLLMAQVIEQQSIVSGSPWVVTRLVRVTGGSMATTSSGALSVTELLRVAHQRSSPWTREVEAVYLEAARRNVRLCGGLLAYLGEPAASTCGP